MWMPIEFSRLTEQCRANVAQTLYGSDKGERLFPGDFLGRPRGRSMDFRPSVAPMVACTLLPIHAGAQGGKFMVDKWLIDPLMASIFSPPSSRWSTGLVRDVVPIVS